MLSFYTLQAHEIKASVFLTLSNCKMEETGFQIKDDGFEKWITILYSFI